MKRLVSKKLIFAGLISLLVAGSLLCLFYDAFFGTNFRSMQDPILSTENVDLRGLREIRASGGTLVRFSDLQRELKHIDGPVIIVDGMSEYHGYIRGIPTTFFAYHKPPSTKHLIRRFLVTGSTEANPKYANSEEDEAKRHHFGYKKVDIGSTFVSSDDDIDKIVAFYDSVPANTWLHFHCSHGKGRTSIMLVMLDTLKNAPQVALKDIVRRQHLLGSENLFNTEVWKHGTYDKVKLEHRKEFVEKFYAFVCQRKAGGFQKWSEWHQARKREAP